MSNRPLPASQNVLSMIHILSNRVTRAFSSEVETKFEITLAEWRVILMLNQRPGTTANEITRRWAMEKMAVNRAIRKLEDDGAISRTRKRHDKRSYELNLTERGQKIRGNPANSECSVSTNYIRFGAVRTVGICSEIKPPAGQNRRARRITWFILGPIQTRLLFGTRLFRIFEFFSKMRMTLLILFF